jgi:hypothetical protein
LQILQEFLSLLSILLSFPPEYSAGVTRSCESENFNTI